MAEAARRIIVLFERDLYDLCQKEKSGRVPMSVEFAYVELPADLASRLQDAKKIASTKVSPEKGKQS